MRLPVIGKTYELSAIVDEEDYRTLDLGSYKWYRLLGPHTTYAKAHKNGKTIYLHRLIMGLVDAPRSEYVDHIDGNGLNNSRTNLRKTDNRGNQRNQTKHLSATSTSTYKGVCYRSGKYRTKPWMANITLSDKRPLGADKKVRGKQKYLGCYQTEIEAATAYNQAAIELFGPSAHQNDIGPSPTP